MDMSDQKYVQEYKSDNPGHQDLVSLANFMIESKSGLASFSRELASIIRNAYDEVIDMPRTQRWSISNLSQPEKTYIGTKVEILVQHWLDVGRGQKLDLEINGIEVDVKNTVSGNWMIPTEAVDEICLLISGDEVSGKYSVGLFRSKSDYLNKGANKDGKRSISKIAGFAKIFWLVRDGTLPSNFFLELNDEDRKEILAGSSGADRVRRLFRCAKGIVIPRSAVEGVANQKDALKRLRKNGGAREALLAENLLILSGKYDKSLIEQLGLVELANDEFISIERERVERSLGASIANELFSSH